MSPLVRSVCVSFVLCISTPIMAQLGFIMPNNIEQAHIRKIDSLDTYKPDLNVFKEHYRDSLMVKAFDTTKRYILRYSDTVKYDRSERRFVFREFAFGDTLYQMDSNSNLYYRSRTFKHQPAINSAEQILDAYLIQSKWFVPYIPDSRAIPLKPDNKRYVDYFVPHLYNSRYLVLQQHHGYHGYNHVGLVNFSNTICHYFEVLD